LFHKLLVIFLRQPRCYEPETTDAYPTTSCVTEDLTLLVA